ncbi:hypothetical protein H4S06_006277, partial [Coemansia sp. BCRC 34490]
MGSAKEKGNKEPGNSEEKTKLKHKRRKHDADGEQSKHSEKSDKKVKKSKRVKSKDAIIETQESTEDKDDILSMDNADNATVDADLSGDRQMTEDAINMDEDIKAGDEETNGLVPFPDFSRQFNASGELVAEAL